MQMWQGSWWRIIRSFGASSLPQRRHSSEGTQARHWSHGQVRSHGSISCMRWCEHKRHRTSSPLVCACATAGAVNRLSRNVIAVWRDFAACLRAVVVSAPHYSHACGRARMRALVCARACGNVRDCAGGLAYERMLSVVCCILHAAYCMLHIACCILYYVAYCMLHIVLCCILHVARSVNR